MKENARKHERSWWRRVFLIKLTHEQKIVKRNKYCSVCTIGDSFHHDCHKNWKESSSMANTELE